MMPAELQVLIRHVRRFAGRRELVNRSDRDLLTEYARQRDEEAFTALVSRHAGLVAGVCRRVLRNEQDVEDAFQATFLVLSRRARSRFIPESVASWLHSVAFRLALRTRKNAARRQQVERDHQAQTATTYATSSSVQQCRELQELLDQELARLPESCRIALILCYLEGRTRDQAARQSGCSLRTIDRRLEEGRQLLRARLARRGLDLSVVVLAAALAEPATASCAKLTASAVQFVMAQGAVKIGVACTASKLANSALPWVSGQSLKIGAGIVLMIALASAGVGVVRQTAKGDEPASDGYAMKPSPRKTDQPSVPHQQIDLFGDALPPGAMARLGGGRFRISDPDRIAYSSDGKMLFAGGQQGIKLFEAATGRVIRTFGEELKTPCMTSAFSPDGKLAAVGGLQGSPSSVVYETVTGKRLCELQPPEGSDTRLGGFSPDGTLVATTVHQCRVDLYHSRTGKFIRTLEWEHDGQPRIAYGDVAFMPDGKTLLATTPSTGTIRVFEIQSGKEIRHFTAAPNGLKGMVLSSDGTRLAVLENAVGLNRVSYPDNKIRILDAQTGQQLAEFIGHKILRNGMAFLRDGKSLFAGEDEQGICIWDTATGKRTGSVASVFPSEYWRSLAVAPDGKTIALGDMACIHVCEVLSGKELDFHPGHTAAMISVAIDPFNSIVATGGRDGRLLLWERTTGRMVRELAKSTGGASCVIFDRTGRYLYSISEFSVEPKHSSIRCWNPANGKELWRIDDHPANPAQLAISPDGKMLAAIGPSEGLLLEAATGKPIRTLNGEGEVSFFHIGWGSKAELAFSPDGSQLLAWGHSKGIHRWDTATGEHSSQETDARLGLTCAVAFAPDRKYLVIGGAASKLLVIDVATGRSIRDIKAASDDHAGKVFGVAFSPDGRTLAWGGPSDGVVHLTDFATGVERKRLNCLSGRSIPSAFSNDGKLLVTTSLDGTALVWDLERVPGRGSR